MVYTRRVVFVVIAVLALAGGELLVSAKEEGASALSMMSLHGNQPTTMTTLKAETKGEQNAEATTSANGIASNKRTRSQSGTIASGEARNKNGKRSASSWISSAFALNDANTLVKNEAKSTSGFPTEEQYNLLLSEIAMLQSELDSAESDVARLQAELDDASAESAGLQAQNDDSTECAENNANLETQINELQAAIATAKQEITEVEADIANLQDQFDTADSVCSAEKAGLEGQISETAGDLSECTDNLGTSTSELDECTAEKDAAESACSAEIADLEGQLDEVVEERDGLQSELDACEARNCLQLVADPPQIDPSQVFTFDQGG